MRGYSIESILLVGALLLIISVLTSKASGRLGIPALLLFIFVGMAAGSEGPGGIYFDDPWLTQLIGSAALALILFSGGLDTKWSRVRPVARPAILLATIGVSVTAVAVGLFCQAFLGFSLLEGILLGSIISSTDAAAVFSILRTRQIRLKGGLESLLEFESGSNDPMAVLLTITMTQLLIQPEASLATLAWMFVKQIVLGLLLGLFFGRLMLHLLNSANLVAEGLYPVLSTAAVLLIFSVSMVIGGNGYLVVYLAGLILGNSNFIHKRSLMRFHDGSAWMMQIVMFLTLGLLVFPSEVVPVAGTGLLVAICLMFIARPVSVFLTLAFERRSLREKLLLSWVGLRGAVPIILATYPLVAGIPNADLIFNIVFFVVLTSVLLQGTTISLAAKWLNLSEAEGEINGAEPGLDWLEKYDGQLKELTVSGQSAVRGKRLVDAAIPERTLVLLIQRQGEYLIPKGGTTFEEGDQVLVLGDDTALTETGPLF